LFDKNSFQFALPHSDDDDRNGGNNDDDDDDVDDDILWSGILEKLLVPRSVKWLPNPKVHYRVHNSSPLAPAILSHMSPV
jgi:hypothetical protein